MANVIEIEYKGNGTKMQYMVGHGDFLEIQRMGTVDEQVLATLERGSTLPTNENFKDAAERTRTPTLTLVYSGGQTSGGGST